MSAPSTASTPSSIVDLPLESLRPSTTNVQTARRARFDAKALAELTATIREVGVLEPILVRPLGDASASTPTPTPVFEIVAGERRWRAATDAGRLTIPAIVKLLTDAEVLQLQLIENIQREDLHPLAEVEAFDDLMKHHGYTVQKLADDLGKPRAYVYQRLKLLALCAPARQAFSKGKLTLATAFLLARIPVEELQRQALKDITEERTEPMSARAVASHLESRYMLRLADAAFPTQDAELVAAAGPCGTCPKRTGNQPELFKDVRGADVCTDPVCFEAKRVAFNTRQLTAAKAAGRTLIDGHAAKKIAPYGPHHLEGHVRLTDRCYEDPKNRTYRQLLGDAVPTALLVVPQTGDLIEIVDRKAIASVLKQRGITTHTSRSNDTDRARRDRAKRESVFRWQLFEAVRQTNPVHLERRDLELLGLTTFARHGYEARKRLLKVWAWTTQNGEARNGKKSDVYDYARHDEIAADRIPKLSDADLARFLLDCVYVSDLQVSTWSHDKPERLTAAAERLGIDVDALRKASAPPPKPRAAKRSATAENAKPSRKRKGNGKEKEQPQTNEPAPTPSCA